MGSTQSTWDENFHLRNEIYNLQDKINRQVLLIHKLETQLSAKTSESQTNAQATMQNKNNVNEQSDMESDDDEDDIIKEDDVHHDDNDDDDADDNEEEDVEYVDVDDDAEDESDDPKDMEINKLRRSLLDLSLSGDWIPTGFDMKMVAHSQFKGRSRKQNVKEDPSIHEAVIRLHNMEREFDRTLNNLFGASLTSLIPYQLNENVLAKYYSLFDAYHRNICGDAMVLPKDIRELISFYFPLFVEVETVLPTYARVDMRDNYSVVDSDEDDVLYLSGVSDSEDVVDQPIYV